MSTPRRPRCGDKDFRFRIFDKLSQKIRRPEFICFDATTGEISYAAGTDEDGKPWDLNAKDMVVDQDTGLLDKNGGHVFEHDIIRYDMYGYEYDAVVAYDSHDAEWLLIDTDDVGDSSGDHYTHNLGYWCHEQDRPSQSPPFREGLDGIVIQVWIKIS